MSGKHVEYYAHLLVRLPVFSITAAVQQVLVSPPVMLEMSRLTPYGRDVSYMGQVYLQPLAQLVFCCPVRAFVQLV